MLLQLNPPIPVITPMGPALATILIDDGIEHDLKWVCINEKNGECWTYRNRYIRGQLNVTHGRTYVSPFYDPNDVAFPSKDEEDEEEDDEFADEGTLGYYRHLCTTLNKILDERMEKIKNFRFTQEFLSAKINNSVRNLESLITDDFKKTLVDPQLRLTLCSIINGLREERVP